VIGLGSFILRAAPDRDLYVLWSSVCDDAEFVGTRDEVAVYLSVQYGYDHPAERWLTRADATGTSSRIGAGAWGHDLVVDQCGMLRRSDLGHYAEAWAADDQTAIEALLTPFDHLED
jgi:hypothetical protein